MKSRLMLEGSKRLQREGEELVSVGSGIEGLDIGHGLNGELRHSDHHSFEL